MKITDLQPKLVWHYFDAITKIPRATYNEKPMVAYLTNEIKKLGYEPEVDHVFNVFFKVSATKGCENIPITLLQGHHDMVAVKTKESTHDFSKDPIETIVTDDGWLRAKDTSLGADNGIAIAMVLAILADKNIQHGPLEILFTADEESGMDGMEGFDVNKLKCKYIINLDSEIDSEISIGCEGTVDIDGIIPFTRDTTERLGTGNLKITIAGGLGGHSGAQSHNNRINTIKEIFNLVYILSENHDLRIVEVCKSGVAFNVIPFEASIIINLKKENIDLSKYLQDLRTAFPLETHLTLSYEWVDTNLKPMTKTDSDKVLHTFNGIFNGLHVFNSQYNIGESSSNLGKIETTQNTIASLFLVRGSYDIVMKHLANSIVSSLKAVGAEGRIKGFMGAWLPKPNPLATYYAKFFEQTTHKPCKQMLIPGGVEVAVLISKRPEMLCLSIGPTMEDVHSTDERLNIKSTELFFTVLCKFLPSIK